MKNELDLQPSKDGPKKGFICSADISMHVMEITEARTRRANNMVWLNYAVIRDVCLGISYRYNKRTLKRERGYDFETGEKIDDFAFSSSGIVGYEEGRGIITQALLTMQIEPYLSNQQTDNSYLDNCWKRGITHHFHNGNYNASIAFLKEDYETIVKYESKKGRTVKKLTSNSYHERMAKIYLEDALCLFNSASQHTPTAQKLENIPVRRFIIEPFALEEIIKQQLREKADHVQIPKKIYNWTIGKYTQ